MIVSDRIFYWRVRVRERNWVREKDQERKKIEEMERKNLI